MIFEDVWAGEGIIAFGDRVHHPDERVAFLEVPVDHRVGLRRGEVLARGRPGAEALAAFAEDWVIFMSGGPHAVAGGVARRGEGEGGDADMGFDGLIGLADLGVQLRGLHVDALAILDFSEGDVRPGMIGDLMALGCQFLQAEPAHAAVIAGLLFGRLFVGLGGQSRDDIERRLDAIFVQQRHRILVLVP